MVSLRNLALAASAIIGLTTAAPTTETRQAAYTPGTQNNTQEFYLHMTVTDGDTKYNGWSLEAWHTGAGFADPVFVNGTGTPAFLNGTHLQFDQNPYAFSALGSPSDTNYARWEPVGIQSGYGTGAWKSNGSDGWVVDAEEFGGWLVCEWFHGINAPQLFQLISGFDAEPYTIPSSCARVLLFAVYI
ncbi:hypothetical protein LOCC1_G004580 [Lachnellula occidentalis]|uniref:DUF7907 domain-containing protein n=1 Tax=Lachnellula occidentalis TaxID=215460 RepID=A0A8H8S492_9HELO|nr:hypothetical protein LOCC1_G004580 [Lachnellula occidentalis]